jgi:hypothetical protein
MTRRILTTTALAIGLAFAAAPAVATAQDLGDPARDRATMDRDTDWGWIGLIGLAGLAGLMRRERPHYQATPARP